MTETLMVGEYPKNSYYAVRGDTGVFDDHLKKFYACGINCSHNFEGTVWISTSTRFLYPGDKVNQKHLDLLTVYDNYITQKPTNDDEYRGELPFSTYTLIDYTAMTIVGGNGPKSTWYHYWKDGLLYVHKNNGEVTIHEVYDPNESILEAVSRRRLYGMRRLGTSISSGIVPTHCPTPKPDDPDDPDDDVPMPSLFGDDDDDSDDDMGGLFD